MPGQITSMSCTSTFWLPVSASAATAALARRAETPMRNPPVTSLIKAQRVQPARQLLRQLRFAKRRQRLDDAGEREIVFFFPCPKAGGGRIINRPHQRDGLGEVADIIVRKFEQYRIGALRNQRADETGFGMWEAECAGERCQRPAALGIACRAKIVDHQPQLIVAARLVSEAVEQLGEAVHEPSLPWPGVLLGKRSSLVFAFRSPSPS